MLSAVLAFGLSVSGRVDIVGECALWVETLTIHFTIHSTIQPRGSKYPTFEASGSENHAIYSTWALKPQIWGA